MGAGGLSPLTLTTERDVCRGSLASSGARTVRSTGFPGEVGA